MVVNSTAGTARVICGKYGCGWDNYGRGMFLGANAVAECRGDYSCNYIVAEQLNGALKCSGLESCKFAKIFSTHTPTVLCAGEGACHMVVVLGNPSLVCEGQGTCTGFHAQLECHDARPDSGKPHFRERERRGSWRWSALKSSYVDNSCSRRKGTKVPDPLKWQDKPKYLNYLHRRVECAAGLGLCSNSTGSELSGKVVCSGLRSCVGSSAKAGLRTQLDGNWDLDCKGSGSCGQTGPPNELKGKDNNLHTQTYGRRVTRHLWEFFYMPAWGCATPGSCNVGCNGRSSCGRATFGTEIVATCRGAGSCGRSKWQVSRGLRLGLGFSSG